MVNLEKELKKRIAKHGFTLERIRPFKNFDRITVRIKKEVFSFNLRAHLHEVNFEAVVDAIIKKQTGKTVG
jgi:hypothetical protein